MPLWQEKQRSGAASWSWNLVSDACGSWQVVQPSAIGRCWWRAAAPWGALCGWHSMQSRLGAFVSSFSWEPECGWWHTTQAPTTTGPWTWALSKGSGSWQVTHSSRVASWTSSMRCSDPCGSWQPVQSPWSTGA
jgi:hypothetical protein